MSNIMQNIYSFQQTFYQIFKHLFQNFKKAFQLTLLNGEKSVTVLALI